MIYFKNFKFWKLSADIYVTESNSNVETEKQDFKTLLSYLSTNSFLYCKRGILITYKEELSIQVFSSNNQTFSIILLENIDNEISITYNEIPITFELITPSKKATETTARRTSSKSSVNDSPADILERFTNHLQQQILFLKQN